MITKRSLFGIVCRAAAFSFLVAGSASLMQAQQSSSVESAPKAPLLLASESAPLDLTSNSSSSSSDSAAPSDGRFLFSSSALDSTQPPPRRHYGHPNYSDSHSNPDGSPKWAFLAGAGLTLPVGNTHKYQTESWAFQVGGGRNFNKTFGVLAQFDYDHFGLQGKTLANQEYVYNYYCTPAAQAANLCSIITNLDGNNHVWSFTLNPTYTFPTEGSFGVYLVAGGGFYHKVTNFTVPTTGYYFDPYYGYIAYSANQIIDHYTSNAFGVNGGIGFTYKFSQFSNQRFYMETRYVLMLNSQRYGITPANVGTSFGLNYTGFNYYPQNSNRTTYIPIKFGIRF
jgi:Outer membrane protein beta-barrel domain